MTTVPKVVHIKSGEPFDMYVGRPTDFGNPFSHKENTKAEFVVSSRKEAIEKFESWIKQQPELLRRVKAELKNKVLACWCSPKACHADILLKIANEPQQYYDWKSFLAHEREQEYFQTLMNFVVEDAKKHTVYPPHKELFNAFNLCPLEKIKVVILGQDCYHGKGQAHGLAFSVRGGVKIPPSLQNIFKEINADFGTTYIPDNGCLEYLAKQGVFLLNSILTVRDGQPGSHANHGWEIFTDNAIKLINDIDRPIVYMLWGNYARSKKALITNKKHLVLESPHPSPFSAHTGFLGCKHFSKANNFLKESGMEGIEWLIK